MPVRLQIEIRLSFDNEFKEKTQAIYNSLNVYRFQEESYQTWINGIVKGMKEPLEKSSTKIEW